MVRNSHLSCQYLDPKLSEKHYDEKTETYFFDRHKPSFPGILYFYQSTKLDEDGRPSGIGHISRPLDVPMGNV